MTTKVSSFIRAKKIDSFQKLRLLLLLNQNPHLKGTSQEFAHRLYLGDIELVKNIVADLQRVDLIERVDNHYKLLDKPEVRTHLRQVAWAFEHPVRRQALLEQVKLNPPANRIEDTAGLGQRMDTEQGSAEAGSPPAFSGG